MRAFVLTAALILIVTPFVRSQTTGNAEAKGPCSPAVTGSSNQFTITCQGMSDEQGAKMLRILNKILANQLDAKVVMVKLDEILKAVNPNAQIKTYFCNGSWRTVGPGPNTAMEINVGGDDAAFQEMMRLNNSRNLSELLKLCTTQMRTTPEWLTPNLFCALAYAGQGNSTKAKELVTDYDLRSGPAYAVDACKQMSDFLHQRLK